VAICGFNTCTLCVLRNSWIGSFGFFKSASWRAPVGQASQQAVVNPLVIRW